MFDIGWSEMLVIGIVALIAIGPKELPGVLRAVGQWMGKIRRMAADFQGQFQDAMREAEMADIKKQVDEMTSAASSVTNYDPLGDISKQFETAIDDKPAAASTDPAVATAPPAPEVAAPAELAVNPDNTAASAHDVAHAAAVTAPEPAGVPAAQPKAGSGA